MSHTVTIKTQFKDEAAIRAACNELGLAAPTVGTHDLFQGKVTGLAVKLNGWQYPVVIDTKTGEAKFDNYGGRWGSDSELQRFTQIYGVHKATAAARAKGYSVARQPGKNGSIQLVVTGF